jgi:hypothetical protein
MASSVPSENDLLDWILAEHGREAHDLYLAHSRQHPELPPWLALDHVLQDLYKTTTLSSFGHMRYNSD